MVSIIDVLIFLHLYGLYLTPAFLIAGYFGLVRLFTFPLMTRNPHELVLMIAPGRVKVYKVTNRYSPIFTVKKGAYWFAQGLQLDKVNFKKKIVHKERTGKMRIVKRTVTTEPAQAQIMPNIVHTYVDAINQPIVALDRFETKVMDLVTHRDVMKQVKPHTVYIPTSLKCFAKNWILRIYTDGSEPELEITTVKQPYKINLFTRIGIYIVNKQEQESENTSAGNQVLAMQSVTVQTVKQKIGDIEQNANYSAAFAFKILHTLRKMERGWILSLLGSIDPRIIVILIGMACVIAAVFLLGKPAGMESLGPPPEGCTNC